jgi:hypothetical protein
MEKITSAARRQVSFPSPIDVHAEHGDEEDKKETDEKPAALQSPKAKRTFVAVSTREGKMMKL